MMSVCKQGSSTPEVIDADVNGKPRILMRRFQGFYKFSELMCIFFQLRQIKEESACSVYNQKEMLGSCVHPIPTLNFPIY